MQVQSLGWEDPLEEGMATVHSSILAWRIQWAEEPGGLQSMELQRVRHNRNDLAQQHKKGEAKGGNRQNRLHLESRTPSWALL